MYLRHLAIKGFKSFAEKTEIHFEPGINIIVGPNGCGKSNIVDAVRWVLGEANVRHLRGIKQEDIIFSGTDKNSPLGLANVEMGIDNSDHALPIEFTEISLGRKLYRSGESEYNINKVRVRLKDINELFTGTGLGKQGFSIIGQGELEEVLTGHPYERRLILEEASGIIKYRQERDEVKKRIASTEGDLIRLSDLLVELKGQWEVLQTKQEKAQKYLTLQERLAFLQQQVMGYEISQLKCQLAEKNDRFTQENMALVTLTGQLDEQKFILLDLENSRIQLNKRIMAWKDAKYKKENSLRDLESEDEKQRERIKNFRDRITQNQINKEKYTGLLNKLNADLSINTENCTQEKQVLREKEDSVRRLQEELQMIKAEMQKDNEGLELQNTDLERQKENLIALESAITNLKTEIGGQQERKKLIKIINDEDSNQIKDLHGRVLEIERQLSDFGSQAQDLNAKHNDVKYKLQEKSLQQAELKNQLHNNTQLMQKLNNRLATLLELENNLSYYSEGVRNILKAAGEKNAHLTGIKGTLGELITVSPGLELAIETIAGRSLENIVVSHSADAQAAIQYLKNNHLGRATFLPLDILQAPTLPDTIRDKIIKAPGVIGIGNEIVAFDRSVKKAVDYLLGKVVIVEKLSDGLKLFKNIRYALRIVSLEGDLLNASGAMTGGAGNHPKSSLLQRRNEKIRVREQLEKARTEVDKLEQEGQMLRGIIQNLEKEKEDTGRQLSELAFKTSLLETNKNELQTKLQDIKSKQDINMSELQSLLEALKQAENQLAASEEQYNQVQNQNISCNERLLEKKNYLEKLQRDYELKTERLQAQQEQLDMKRKEIANLEDHIHQFCQVRDSYLNSLQEAEKQLSELEKNIGTQQDAIGQLLMKKEEAEQELQQLAAELKAAELAEVETNQKLQLLKKDHLLLQQKTDELDQKVRNLEIQKIRLEAEYDNLLEKWKEQFGSKFAINKDIHWEKNEVRQYRQESAAINDDLETLGPVDLQAIEEFKAVSSRYDFLKKQYDDLMEAKQSLTKLLNETEVIMHNCFAQFYQEANHSFQNTFRQIFDGGEASLTLEDTSDDSLAAGIEIMVKMPGKRIQNMNLLSGGERALTCIAFIFALLNLKSTPFCLLDEIDAALDEHNLIRFTKYLKQMATKIQFIVISHRQSTIAAANKIYGITMARQGISTVLSLNLSGVSDYLPAQKAIANV